MNIRDALLLIRGHAERQAGTGEMASLYQLFTRSRLAFADGLCWLHSAPALPFTVDRLLLPWLRFRRRSQSVILRWVAEAAMLWCFLMMR